jgi:hypothetical protein
MQPIDIGSQWVTMIYAHPSIILFILLVITTKDFIGGGIFSLISVGIYQVWVNLLDLDRKHILRLALLILLFLLFLAILGSMIG